MFQSLSSSIRRQSRSRLGAFIGLLMVLLLLPLPVLAQGTPSTSNQSGSNTDWPYYGNDQGGMHYQDLDQINPGNVSQLQPAWILHTGVAMNNAASFENQPIVADGMMFVSTGHDQVLALDPATGDIKWTYNPTDMPPLNVLPTCCGQDNRGVAVANGEVFIERLDANLVALDEQTGKVNWEVPVEDWHNGYGATMAPAVVDNEVIVGISGAEMEVRGFVAAYDQKTGKQLWRFYTVPGPGEVGHDSWAGNSWLTGGATVWDHPEIDQKLGLVYFSTANASPDYDGSRRGGDNLFAASIVALNYKTGKLAWYFQEVHHDIWDYDGPEPTMLFTFTTKDGQQVPAIGHGNKAGYYFILDRRNGKPLIPVKEVPVPTDPSWQLAAPTQPQPVGGWELIPHTVNPKDVPAGAQAAPMWTPPHEQGIVINPGSSGGPQWPPAAFSPRTGYVYVPAGGYMPHEYFADPNYPENTLGSEGKNITTKQYGLFDAVDATTGKIAWQVKTPWKAESGIAVAGDIVFLGRDSGEFDAYNAKTGKLLWKWNNPTHEPKVGGANGSPAVYMVNGREYVVMPFGGNESVRSYTGQKSSPNGDALIAFALPQGSAASGGDTPQAGTGQAKPHVVTANIKDVPVAGRFPGKTVKVATKAPAGSTVYTVQYHDALFFPDTVVVKPGETVAIHLVNTSKTSGTGIAVSLPDGEIALAGQVAAGHDAYFVFTAPNTPGAVYQFYAPAQSRRYEGPAGLIRVAQAGETTTAGTPAAAAPVASPGTQRVPGSIVVPAGATPAVPHNPTGE